MIPILKTSLIAVFLAFVIWMGIFFFWRNADVRFGAALGLALSWGVSTISLFILSALVRSSMKIFLWAWLGGIGIRLLVLGALMTLSWHWAMATQAALLLSYALGVLVFIIMEYRPLVSREAVA